MKGIYCYVDNKTDDIVYVGKDSKIDKHNNRHYQHTRKCNYNHQVINKIIQNNPSRYTYEVLFKGKSKHIDDNLLNTLEMGYIETYKPKFNFTNGGDGRTGAIPWNKGKKFPKETHPLYGKHHSDETRLKISKNHHNVKGENNPRYREDIPQGKELYFENKSGLSYNELAEKYNCGWSTIQRRIKKYKRGYRMGLLDELNKRFFTRESVSSNVKTTTSNLHNRISLKPKKDKIPYETGVRIMMDTQVSTGFDILKYLLSSKQWVLIANENDTVGVFDFINNMFFNMETELNEVVKQTVTALPWGFSIHELLYDLNNNGKLIVKNAIPIHIKTLQNNPFTYDENGELVSIHQEYNGEDVEIPINKVFKYSFNANYDEDAGNGLLYDFIPIVEDKLNINNWLMTFLEKHESPTLYGKTSNPASRDAMLSAFDDIQDGTTGLVVGVEDDVGVLESSHRGETFFRTLQYKDNQIFRRYYLGNLLLGDNSQTGTYAQSQTQLEFGSLVFDGILEEIANCIQKQIINPIVEANYGDITLAPTISFDKFTTGDLTALFNTIKPLIDSGVVDSENPAVQDSIALIFKKETGLNYTNETEPINEEFNLPPDNEELTTNILDQLEV